ncbi:MAG: RagB/SusD family nutrient uptake outer membrane protein [Muribaculaceae bacterium]|nr:RagB/SusD family nutrient uptake outer membrane protein [Muribaculaceae bacterium]
MKAINKILALAAVSSLSLVSCNDLDTEPMGGTVTSDQKEQVYEGDPAMIEAAVNAVPGMTYVMMGNYDSFGRVDTDFGFPSLNIMYDSRSNDMPSKLGDYQWYTAALTLEDFSDNYFNNLISWNTMYNLIYTSNDLAKVIPMDTEQPYNQMALAQALAFRAYGYFYLAQLYQFTYVGHEDEPTVPLITHLNAEQVALEGTPRASNREIYAQIVEDYTNAIELLEKSEAAGQPRINKTFINSTVALVLRARAYLNMGMYDECIADVNKALQKAQAEGLAPYSIQKASAPAFNALADNNVLWGLNIDPSFIGSAAVRSFAGMMGCWLNGMGYFRYGFFRCINKALYESIPSTDVRKAWWLDGDAKPAATIPAAYKDYITNHESFGCAEFEPYVQMKFGAYQNNVGTTIPASEIPTMRMEELYLILAEAQGRKSVGEGVNTLVNFVKTYRDPSYALSAGSTEEFINALWWQRRVELWGEGFAYFDIMRLKRSIDRRGGGFDPTLVFVVAPEDPCLIYVIPQTEQQANPQIGTITSTASAPVPVPDNN